MGKWTYCTNCDDGIVPEEDTEGLCEECTALNPRMRDLRRKPVEEKRFKRVKGDE